MKMPNWDDILILGAQLNPPPLMEHDPVSTTTVIGKHAEKPMVLDMPVYISHMSFGAMSKEMKTALAKGSAMAKTAMCSGREESFRRKKRLRTSTYLNTSPTVTVLHLKIFPQRMPSKLKSGRVQSREWAAICLEKR